MEINVHTTEYGEYFTIDIEGKAIVGLYDEILRFDLCGDAEELASEWFL